VLAIRAFWIGAGGQVAAGRATG